MLNFNEELLLLKI